MTAALAILTTGVLWDGAIVVSLARQLRATRRRTRAALQANHPTSRKPRA